MAWGSLQCQLNWMGEMNLENAFMSAEGLSWSTELWFESTECCMKPLNPHSQLIMDWRACSYKTRLWQLLLPLGWNPYAWVYLYRSQSSRIGSWWWHIVISHVCELPQRKSNIFMRSSHNDPSEHNPNSCLSQHRRWVRVSEVCCKAHLMLLMSWKCWLKGVCWQAIQRGQGCADWHTGVGKGQGRGISGQGEGRMGNGLGPEGKWDWWGRPQIWVDPWRLLGLEAG